MRTGAAISTNTSRAYWELRAEQVMDRVFQPVAGTARLADDPSPGQPESIAVEVEVTEAPAPEPPARRSGTPLLWLCGSLTGLALVGVTLLGLAWSRATQELQQERTLRLLQGLRELRVDGSGDAAAPAAGEPTPPPPPGEPWMEQLAELDGGGSAAPPLQVPLHGPLTGAAPALTTPPPLPPLPAAAPGGGATPELVGVVQSPGRGGSAIFRLNGSFSNASSGDSIGGSGWRLLSTSGDSALIERDGVSRRVSIGSGL